MFFVHAECAWTLYEHAKMYTILKMLWIVWWWLSWLSLLLAWSFDFHFDQRAYWCDRPSCVFGIDSYVFSMPVNVIWWLVFGSSRSSHQNVKMYGCTILALSLLCRKEGSGDTEWKHQRYWCLGRYALINRDSCMQWVIIYHYVHWHYKLLEMVINTKVEVHAHWGCSCLATNCPATAHRNDWLVSKLTCMCAKAPILTSQSLLCTVAGQFVAILYP